MYLGCSLDINLYRDRRLMSHIEILAMKRFNLEKATSSEVSSIGSSKGSDGLGFDTARFETHILKHSEIAGFCYIYRFFHAKLMSFRPLL